MAQVVGRGSGSARLFLYLWFKDEDPEDNRDLKDVGMMTFSRQGTARLENPEEEGPLTLEANNSEAGSCHTTRVAW